MSLTTSSRNAPTFGHLVKSDREGGSAAILRYPPFFTELGNRPSRRGTLAPILLRVLLY